MKESQIISFQYTSAATALNLPCLLSFRSSCKNSSNDSPDFCFLVASWCREKISLGVFTYRASSVLITVSKVVHSSTYSKT